MEKEENARFCARKCSKEGDGETRQTGVDRRLDINWQGSAAKREQFSVGCKSTESRGLVISASEKRLIGREKGRKRRPRSEKK